MEQSTSPVPEVQLPALAQRLLRKRSRRLLREMRRCARGSGDAESVHQLRVATRRIDAVLRLFGPLYPSRRWKRARHQVRRLRQASRQVRDLDVLLDRLPPPHDCDADLSSLITALRIRRHEVVQDLHKTLRKRKRKRLQSRLARLCNGPHRECAPTGDEFRATVETLLGPCIAAFRAAASGNLSDTAALHRFRLQGKRLRYTLELLADPRDTGAAAALMTLLKELQEQLGHINDHASAAEVLGVIGDSATDAGIQSSARRLSAEELRRLDEKKAAFLHRWNADGATQTRGALGGLLADLCSAEVAAGAAHGAE